MVAAILLSVSLFMAAVSSCVVVAAISYGGSSQMQAEAIYDGYMGNLVDNSSYQVDEYYKAYVESQDDTQENHTIRYYKDYFNEKNSNFYFEVVPDDASLISGRTIMYRTNMMRITAAMKRTKLYLQHPGKFLCQSVTCTGIGAIFPLRI